MSKETVDGITKIAVSGFKSLAKECTIDIRPLTILAGANSSGKSSIMQPLLMLKQTLEAPYDPGSLLIEGPNVQFTLAEQFLSKLVGKERAERFQIRIETHEFDFSHSVTTTFRKDQKGIELVEMTMKSELGIGPPKHITLYPGMLPEDVKSQADQYLIPENFYAVRRLRCSLRLESPEGHTYFVVPPSFESNIFNSIYLPGLRGKPERTGPLASTNPPYPGPFQHYAASIIHEWRETRNERLETLADALYTLGLTRQVATKKNR